MNLFVIAVRERSSPTAGRFWAALRQRHHYWEQRLARDGCAVVNREVIELLDEIEGREAAIFVFPLEPEPRQGSEEVAEQAEQLDQKLRNLLLSYGIRFDAKARLNELKRVAGRHRWSAEELTESEIAALSRVNVAVEGSSVGTPNHGGWSGREDIAKRIELRRQRIALLAVARRAIGACACLNTMRQDIPCLSCAARAVVADCEKRSVNEEAT